MYSFFADGYDSKAKVSDNYRAYLEKANGDGFSQMAFRNHLSRYLSGQTDPPVPKAVAKASVSRRSFNFAAAKELDLQLSSAEEVQKYAPQLENMPTGKYIDKFIAFDEGVERGAVYGGYGKPGTGKTTLFMDMARSCKRMNPDLNVLLVQAEMDELDMVKTVGAKAIEGIQTYFISPFSSGMDDDEDSVSVSDQLMSLFVRRSWDIVIIDSFAVLVNFLKNEGMTEKTAIQFLLQLMIYVKSGKPEVQIKEDRKVKVPTDVFTTFLCINHANKGGDYVGSTMYEHMLTANYKFVISKKGDGRYMIASKNRRGVAHRRLFYDYIKEEGEIVYDERKYERDSAAIELVKSVDDDQEENSRNFQDLFKSSQGLGRVFTEDGKIDETKTVSEAMLGDGEGLEGLDLDALEEDEVLVEAAKSRRPISDEEE